MSAGTYIALAVAALVFGGGKKKKAAGDGPPPKQDDPKPADPNDPDDPVVVYHSLVSPVPAIGRLWQPTPSVNSAIEAASIALSLPASSPIVQNYVRNLFPASAWNWFNFAVEAKGPYSYAWPGQEVRGFPFAAFYPFNDDVGAAVQAGELPYRRYAFARGTNPNNGNFKPPVLFSGAKQHGIRGYGPLFFPPNTPGHPDDADRNPTDLLTALGKTVQDLRNLTH